jgi:hypothetical protein
MFIAQASNPDKYANAIFEILKKAKDVSDTTTGNNDLDAYAGNYDGYAWGGEDVVLPWKGKLAPFEVPSDNPANSMELYRYISKDTFRRVRKDDDSLGVELHFERDSNGKVVRLLVNNNFENKLK